MNLVIAISTSIVTFAVLFFIGDALYNRKGRLVQRLKEENQQTSVSKENGPFQQWIKAKSKVWALKTSDAKLSKMQDSLDRSGLSRRYTPMEWQLLKLFIVTMIVIVVFVALWLIDVPLLNRVLMSVIVALVMLYAFRWVIILKTKARTLDMQKSLPFTLDLITIGVQVGLSFDSAVLKVIEAQNTALTYEFEKFLKEVRMGVVRRQALKNAMHRIDLDDFRTVAQAVIQADELGASLAHVLKVQSDLIRYKRKMAAREKAVKAPVKMLFPLIFFIFPTIFVIILGPAVIQMAEYFTKP